MPSKQNRAIEDQDVEGHGAKQNRLTDDEADTEGHKRYTEDDVEGHGAKQSRLTDDEADTEGHKR